jgi:hypothetical protein
VEGAFVEAAECHGAEVHIPDAGVHFLEAAALDRTSEIEEAAAEVVKAEAPGQGWLQRTWRPITMLTFVALIVGRWLGWSAPSLPGADALRLSGIAKVGIRGYVIGRSVGRGLSWLIDLKKTS